MGENGSGLGYAGKQNTLAIEFDSEYSSKKNDPKGKKRHLSVIVSTKNEANERDSIGWNDSPVNYNDPKG